MKIPVKVVKTNTPKGGYCGCNWCRGGNLVKYKNDGDKVDGITKLNEHDKYFINIARGYYYWFNYELPDFTNRNKAN